MGYYCTVPQCTSLAGKTKNVKFHRFPRDEMMADKWNLILKRGKPYTKYSKVCSLHFTQADYNVTTMGQWKTLSKDAVPSQNLPRLNPDGTVMVIRKSRTVKYRERKESSGEKLEKWSAPSGQPVCLTSNMEPAHELPEHNNMAYRLQTLSAIASTMPPHNPTPAQVAPMNLKPKKQDAFMQTDPINSEDDDLSQPNNSYSETSETSFNSEQLDYSMTQKNYLTYKEKDYLYKDEKYADKKYENAPKDYTKDDYLPQTNEEYNKEAEKYALERKSLASYEKQMLDYQKPDYVKPDYAKSDYQRPEYEVPIYPKQVYEKPEYPKQDYEKSDLAKPDYQKMSMDGYQFVADYYPYADSVEILRSKQQNLEMLQQQHRVNENQNFFNESNIKQEVDMNSEEEKFMYERAKDQLDASAAYPAGGRASDQRLLEQLQGQVKLEPAAGCENVMQPQGSPYYDNGHVNGTGAGAYYAPRPGPELLIAKQNALAAHTQLWQNTMKRPFFYSETPPYSAIHRYEDLTRILQ